MLKRNTLIFIFTLLILAGWEQTRPALMAQTRHIYLANDNHTDYFWSANEDDYQDVAINEIDYYLDLANSTANLASPFQSRYNLDGAWYLNAYRQNKTPEEFEQLLDKIRSGHFSVPFNMFSSTYGGQPTEAILRGMYWPARMDREHNLNISMAAAIEDQTHPLGLSSLWAGSGVKYSWKGVCGCSSPVNQNSLRNRDHEIYRYQGLDNSEVLMKWYSYISHNALGGYAEAFNPSNAIDQCEEKINTPGYPYNITGAFG